MGGVGRLLDHLVARICEAAKARIRAEESRESSFVTLGNLSGNAGLRLRLGIRATDWL